MATKSALPDAACAEEAEIRAFLAVPGPLAGDRIEVFETHCAMVFVGAFDALKIKRRVTYPYLDFSTLERRRAACERELAVNKPSAPEIYLAVEAITREPDGRLAVGGTGEAIEWAVRMRRFDQGDLLSERVRRGGLDTSLVKDTADMVAQFHAAAPVVEGIDSTALLAAVADEIALQLAPYPAIIAAERIAVWRRRVATHLERARAILARRSAEGQVRRCHGDLHLSNIVVWNGRPVPFDAIEFDERLACIDTLYDLAFLLMDLDRHGKRSAANLILNRVLWRTQADVDLEGLAALPLMLSLRAGIRAFVTLQRASLEGPDRRVADQSRGRDTFAAAEAYLAPSHPRLIAVAGLSGTGKSTLAAGLAPLVGPPPGALHLRSDLERKALFGVDEQDRLPADSYTKESSARVYAHLMRRAGLALAAGWQVIVDAVSLQSTERDALEALAASHGATFHGFWLEAPLEVLDARVAARTADASDATPSVVRTQAAGVAEKPGVNWARIDASGPLEATLAAVRVRL